MEILLKINIRIQISTVCLLYWFKVQLFVYFFDGIFSCLFTLMVPVLAVCLLYWHNVSAICLLYWSKIQLFVYFFGAIFSCLYTFLMGLSAVCLLYWLKYQLFVYFIYFLGRRWISSLRSRFQSWVYFETFNCFRIDLRHSLSSSSDV